LKGTREAAAGALAQESMGKRLQSMEEELAVDGHSQQLPPAVIGMPEGMLTTKAGVSLQL